MSGKRTVVALDDQWESFLNNELNEDEIEENNLLLENSEILNDLNINVPTKGELKISTKSKIAYLNTNLNINEIFWKIPIIPYYYPQEGILKKQIRFNTTSKEQLEEILDKTHNEKFLEMQIITNIDNPTGRTKFKDIRVINVGICKKEVLSYKMKRKFAFYNCFVMIIRILHNDTFKDFHIKVFNTGKLEIPGIPNDDTYNIILQRIIDILQPFIQDKQIAYVDEPMTILINSNFNCGFFIDREKLYNILKYKYNIQCIYDPCSYPGNQCKFFYDTDKKEQIKEQISKKEKKKYPNLVSVSYMIFRTGSVLVVGKCNEDVLYIVYDYICNLLKNEFHNISLHVIDKEIPIIIKKKKPRKKNIYFDNILQVEEEKIEINF
jgi:hypothetical protein